MEESFIKDGRVELPQYSPAVQAARTRRAQQGPKDQANIQWFLKEVSGKIEIAMVERVAMAVDYLRGRVDQNISVPVTKVKGKKTGRIVVTERSKPGEFPRTDTTQLRKTLLAGTYESSQGPSGFVGTPLDYGLILEISPRLNRSFLVRTLNEEKATITSMLTGPIA